MAITKLVLNGNEYDIGNITNITNVVNNVVTEGPQLYTGRELSEYTWAQLKEKCTNNDFSDLRVGDYKTIELTGGEVVVMQIAGIDTYYRTTDQQLGHHIDWISVDCLKTTQQWNTSNDNNGNSTNANPYMVSNIKTVLTGTIYNSLPTDVKNIITNKRMLMESRYSSSGKLTDSTSWAWCDLGTLWLPTEYEVFGSVVWGTKGYSQGQAVQYPLFANSYMHRIKGQGKDDSRCNWWLCTVRSGNSTICCRVDFNGRAGGGDASHSCGVPVCFRIAA
jgi:hypothetical protein